MFRITLCTVGLLATCFISQPQTKSDSSLSKLPPPQTKSPSLPRLQSSFFSRKEHVAMDAKIKEVARDMRQAKSDEEREKAMEALTVLLGKDYDDRLTGYEEELERMEKALAEMRKKLKRRRDAKADMIKLRIKVLEAEAEDLGWPARPRRTSFPSLFSSGGRTSWGTSTNDDFGNTKPVNVGK